MLNLNLKTLLINLPYIKLECKKITRNPAAAQKNNKKNDIITSGNSSNNKNINKPEMNSENISEEFLNLYNKLKDIQSIRQLEDFINSPECNIPLEFKNILLKSQNSKLLFELKEILMDPELSQKNEVLKSFVVNNKSNIKSFVIDLGTEFKKQRPETKEALQQILNDFQNPERKMEYKPVLESFGVEINDVIEVLQEIINN